jgi:hypothetical protein
VLRQVQGEQPVLVEFTAGAYRAAVARAAYGNTAPDDLPTSLDPHELDRHLRVSMLSDAENGSERSNLVFRHSCWAHDRVRMWSGLIDARIPAARLARFAHCGSRAFVLASEDNPPKIRVAATTCRDRWCLPCAKQRSATIAANLLAVAQKQPVRFLTLTLRASDQPLRDQVDRLLQSFARLRRSKLWKTTVTGGAAMIEITRNWERGTWHPHIHALITGGYVPQPQLKDAWQRATGDSYVVDIRKPQHISQVTTYVTKYVTKPWDGQLNRSPHHLAQVITALDHRKLCITFGSWRGLKLTASPSETVWHVLGELSDLLWRARNGDSDARTILDALSANAVCDAMHALPPKPDFPARERPPPPRQLTLFANPLPVPRPAYEAPVGSVSDN